MRLVKKFIIYFPVILVTLQVMANMLAIVWPSAYMASGWYLNLFIGTNVMFAIFLLAFTMAFNFCAISRAAAVAEILFAVNYIIVQQDNLYNILFQVVVGGMALLITYRQYIKKFPLCKLSLLHKFIAALFITGSCESALQRFERDITITVTRNHYAKQHGRHT